MPITYTLYPPPIATSPLQPHIPSLRSMINDAFDSQDRTIYGPTNIFPGQVLRSDDDLRLGYGPVGIAVVAFDITTDESTGEIVSQVPVATAGVKPWKGKEVTAWREFLKPGVGGNMGEKTRTEQLEFKTVVRKARTDGDAVGGDGDGDGHVSGREKGPVEWSLVLVASRTDPRYRGAGIAAQCIKMLEGYLVDARERAVESGAMVKETPIPIWLTALGGIGNVEYYERRGFVVQDMDDAPMGMWGSLGPFKVATMRKVL